jgi:hypothetical protein
MPYYLAGAETNVGTANFDTISSPSTLTIQTPNASGTATTRLVFLQGQAQGAAGVDLYEPINFNAAMTATTTKTQIYTLAANQHMQFNSASGFGYNFRVAGTVMLTMASTGTLTVGRNNVSLRLRDTGEVGRDVLLINDSNNLIFSNDATGNITVQTDTGAAGTLVTRMTIAAGAAQGSSSITFEEPLTCNQNVNLASGKKVQENSVNISPIGKHDIYIPASSMWGSTTNGAAAATIETGATVKNVKVLDFDQTTVESAEFSLALPRNYDNGTILARFYWTATAGSATQTVAWGIEAVALADDDALTAAFGTRVDTTDTLIATSDVHISAQSTAVTIGGTPADADYIHFKITRQTGSDTLAADARLIGMSIEFSTDAAVAA